MIHELANKKFNPKYLQPREYDHKRRCPDISKLKKLINDYPKITIEEGVANIIENIDYWQDAPVWNPETIADATEDWVRYLGE